MDNSSHSFNLYRLQQRLFPVLLGWALGSIATGLFWIKNQDGSVAGFGSQFASWGAVDLILALFGLQGARRNIARQVQGEISPAQHARQAGIFERLVGLNAGLDLGYIAAGAWLAGTPVSMPQKRPGFRSGIGWGIMVQGAFLLVWDLLLALLVHWRRKA